MICLTRPWVLIVLLCSWLMVACGGGGGGQGADPSNINRSSNGNQNLSSSSEKLNPGLPGHFLFYDDYDYAYLMEVESGDYTRIPNTNWEAQDERFPMGTAIFDFSGSYYGGELIVITTDNCKSRNTLETDACIALQDYNGNYLAQFDVDYDMSRKAELSRDHQYIALGRQTPALGKDPEPFEIYDLNGQLISSRVLVNVPAFEWMPDNRLVYAAGRIISFSQVLSTENSHSLELPEAIGQGNIGTISVSPDGSQIAFTLVTSGTLVSTDATLWVMDVETSIINKLADVPDGDAMISSPRWSPDGQWLAVFEGGVGGVGINSSGTSPHMYVMPTTAIGEKVYLLSIVDNERSPEVHHIQRYFDYDRDSAGNSTSDKFGTWNDFFWVP